MQKFNEIYCDYERGKIDAKTLKGKLKIVKNIFLKKKLLTKQGTRN
jgi:hypothetical protein